MKHKTERDDRAFLLSPDDWPRWPILPMKKKGEFWKEERGHGFVFAGHPDTIYFKNIWDIKAEDKVADYPKQVYADVDALLADGWIVD